MHRLLAAGRATCQDEVTECRDSGCNRSSGVAMVDKATGRVVAVMVLLIAIAASLRGYLPGVERAAPSGHRDSGGSLVYVAALLSVSLVIVAVALITRLRDPRRVGDQCQPLSERFSDGQGRPAWRVLVIGAAVLVAWLLTGVVAVAVHRAAHVGQAPDRAAIAHAQTRQQRCPTTLAAAGRGADGDVLRYLIAGTVALLALIVAGAVVTAGDGAPPGRAPSLPNRRAGDTGGDLRVAGAGGRSRAGRDRRPQPRTARGDHRVLCRDGARTDPCPRVPFRRTSTLRRRCWPAPSNATHCMSTAPPSWSSLFEEARFSPHVMTERHREVRCACCGWSSPSCGAWHEKAGRPGFFVWC